MAKDKEPMTGEKQDSAAPKMKTVKCITERKPWADVEGESETRPLKMGEVVNVPVGQAKELVKNGFVTLWDMDMED